MINLFISTSATLLWLRLPPNLILY